MLSSALNPTGITTLPVRVPESEEWPPRMGEEARREMELHGSCTQAILKSVSADLGLDHEVAMKVAGGFHAGMLVGGTCGVYTAGILLLGLLMGRRDPALGREALEPIVWPAQLLHENLTRALGAETCADLRDGMVPGDPLVPEEQACRLSLRCAGLVALGAEAIAGTLQELVEVCCENGPSSGEAHRS